MCDGIKALMKDFDDSKIEKIESLCIPSFKLTMESRKNHKAQSSLQLDDGIKLQGATESITVEVIAGLPN